MDKEQAFEFLCRAAEGISKMFGKYCETVVQEVSGYEITTAHHSTVSPAAARWVHSSSGS